MATFQNEKISATNKKMSTKEECVICCEPFNKSTHARIVCEYASCNYKICTACVRAYLLTTTTEPHCMDCKQPWTPKFMLILTKKWMSETYRPHREKFLCDVEISKIPETMEAAERYKLAQKEHDVRAELRRRIRDFHHEIDLLNRDITESSMREAKYLYNKNPVPAAEKKVFFMSCPLVTCNGMLSTQYKCGICDHYTCHKCHEIIGLNKAAEHTCDANNIASAEAIKKDTRQCPGCHNRIYKTEGCSQMWCTGCHTAFDWNTGRKVVSERLHNPHWLEYQRSINGGQAPRAPGDVPCGGICSRQEMSSIISKFQRFSIEPNISIQLRNMYGFVVEATTNRVRRAREACQTVRDFQEERIKYIVGDITKSTLSATIYNHDKARQKNTELVHVWELISAVGVDTFNRLLASPLVKDSFLALVIDQITQYNNLRVHCNGLFATISNTYNMSVPQINEFWMITHEKFNSKSMLKKIVAADEATATTAATTAAPLAKEPLIV
jgi:hypothetical protein